MSRGSEGYASRISPCPAENLWVSDTLNLSESELNSHGPFAGSLPVAEVSIPCIGNWDLAQSTDLSLCWLFICTNAGALRQRHTPLPCPYVMIEIRETVPDSKCVLSAQTMADDFSGICK